jgi:hypothetical protein
MNDMPSSEASARTQRASVEICCFVVLMVCTGEELPELKVQWQNLTEGRKPLKSEEKRKQPGKALQQTNLLSREWSNVC